MSVPNVMFIDTSILDGQNYNFSSAATSAFLKVAKDQKLTLLLPDPTRREIERHIHQRSQDVIKALKEARRKAPFLKKWKGWPAERSDPVLNHELRKIATDEWISFLKHFEVQDLGYEGVVLTNIMDWYDAKQAPFGTGAKRKEFPDAFTLAALLAYAARNGVSVAVISKDKDFDRACELYNELLYFPSLPALTEAMLSADKRVAQAKQLIEKNTGLIVAEIEEEFPLLGFYHEVDPADVEDVEVDNVKVGDISVIHIGGNEISIAFEATVYYSAYVTADDHSTASIDSSEDWYILWNEYRGTVNELTGISGTAKLSVDSDWNKIERVVTFEIQEDDIFVEELPEEIFRKGE